MTGECKTPQKLSDLEKKTYVDSALKSVKKKTKTDITFSNTSLLFQLFSHKASFIHNFLYTSRFFFLRLKLNNHIGHTRPTPYLIYTFTLHTATSFHTISFSLIS